VPRIGPGDLQAAGVRRWLAGHHAFPALLSLAVDGLRMGHEGPLPQGRYPNRVPLHQVKEVSALIARETRLGWLAPVPAHVPSAGNAPLMTTLKADGSVRLLMDFSNRDAAGTLRGVNGNVAVLEPSPMARPKQLALAVRRLEEAYGEPPVLLVRDISKMYRRIGVDEGDVPAMHLVWQGQSYVSTRAPFGHRSSSAAACSLTTAVAEALSARMEGKATFLAYCDDTVCIAARQHAAEAERLFTAAHADLGLPISVEKAAEAGSWATAATWLGFRHDTVARTHALTAERRQALQGELSQVLRAAQHAETVSRAAFQRLVGRLSHAATVFTAGRAFLVPFHAMLRQQGAALRVTPEARSDAAWWTAFLPRMPAVAAMRRAPGPAAEAWATDASLTGLGGVRYKCLADAYAHRNPIQAFAVKLPKRHEPGEMMTLEAAAAELAVQLWAPRNAGAAVHLLVDNEALSHCLQRGRAKAAPANAHVRRLLLHAAAVDAQVFARHLFSTQNTAADALSRQFESSPPPVASCLRAVLSPVTDCPRIHACVPSL